MRKRKQDKAWRVANADAIALKSREKYQKNREKKLASARSYREANREKIREYDRQRNAIRRKKNAAYYRTKTVERRNPNRTPKWSDFEIMKFAHDVGKTFGLHVDHIIPLRGKNVSGLNCPLNVQWLTPEENQAKFNHFDNSSYQQWRKNGEAGPYLP